MAQHHGWSVWEMEEMVPYERQIYADLLMKHLQELKERSNG